MHKKTYIKVAISALIFVFSLGLVLPAQAFYLEVPQSLKVLPAKKAAPPVVLTQMMQPAPDGEGGMMQQQPSQQGQQMGPGGECAPGTECGPGNGQQWGPGPGDEERQRKEEEMQKQRQAQDFKRIQGDTKRMETNVKQFERMLAGAEKKGTVIPQEAKDILAKIKSMMEAVKNAQSMEELQEMDLGELGNMMQSLEEIRRTVIEGAQRLQEMQKNIKNMERGLLMFEKQVAKLAKQGIAAPAEITETLNKIKTILAVIKSAKTWEEVENAGIEELQDLMMNLDQYRQQLEMLTRWPQTLKQIDKELANLGRELKRAKTIVDRLLKKGMDLTGVYAEFEAAVSRLKSVKEDATAKIKAGESEAAFELIENDFFGQMEDIWQSHQVIMMMSNMGQFASDFKRGIAQSQQLINQLKRKKIDVTELQDLLNQAKTTGNGVLALMKAKPIDEDAIMAGMEEMFNLKNEFENKVAELTGKEEAMPWEQGPQQFQQLSVPSAIQKMVPQKPQQQQGPQNGGEMGPNNQGGGGGMGPGF